MGDYLVTHCTKVRNLHSGDAVIWLRCVDRSLLMQGWQVSYSHLVDANVVKFIRKLSKINMDKL